MNKFYEDEYYPAVILSARSLIKTAKTLGDGVSIRVNLREYMEAVPELSGPPLKDYEHLFDEVDKGKKIDYVVLKKAEDYYKRRTEWVMQLAEALADTFTLEEICDEFGEWIFTEEGDDCWLLIPLSSLNIKDIDSK